MTEFNDINLPADFDDLSKYAPMLEKLRGKGDGFVVPENYFSESAEWSVVGSQLSGKVGVETGFSVPEKYFEELAERIISLVNISIVSGKSSSNELTTDNRQLTTENSFSVPEGYFEKLTDEIISLVNLSIVSGKTDYRQLTTDNSFTVPEGYFAELDETLNTTIALDNLKQDEGFKVPDGYFEKVSDSILTRIAVDELNTGSDADVPEGYFDTLADRIANRIAEEEHPDFARYDKEETIERGRIIVFAEVLKRYARPASIAASIALVIGVSIWFFNHSGNGKESPIAKYTPPVKQQIVIPQVQDSVIPPQQIAVNINDTSSKPVKHKLHRKLNPEPEIAVKDEMNVQKNDVMDQVDLLDVSAIADYVGAQEIKTENQDDAFLNESMIEFLNDVDPSLINNNEKE